MLQEEYLCISEKKMTLFFLQNVAKNDNLNNSDDKNYKLSFVLKGERHTLSLHAYMFLWSQLEYSDVQ